jgi:2,3-bisphosphoglycerate-dependent phosphoglycerate mutase
MAAQLRRAPPLLDESDERCPAHDPRYKNLDPHEIPSGECLADTVARVIPYWRTVIVPEIEAGRKIIIAAHGNSLRALVKHLDNLTDEQVTDLNIPTGVPLVYELERGMTPKGHSYLGDPEEIARAAAAVANQGKAK